MTLYSIANSPAPSSKLFEGPYVVGATFNGMPVTSVSYSSKINAQVHWSVTVDGIQDLGSGIDVKTGTLQIGGWTSPPLAVLSAQASVGGAPTTTFSGSDYYTFRLSSPGITMTTFFDQTVQTVLTTIGTQAGVSVSCTGPETSFGSTSVLGSYIEQFEVQAGSSLLGHISKICKDYGMNYVVTLDGISVFQGFHGTAPSDLFVTGMSHTRNIKEMRTKLVMKKKSKYNTTYALKWDKSGIFTGSFNPPLALSTIRYTEIPVAGHVGYIAYYDGSSLAGYVVLDAAHTPSFPPLTSSGKADSVVYDVVPNPSPFDTVVPKGELFIYGRPYGVNSRYDITFELIGGDSAQQSPDRIEIVESNLWQNADVAHTVMQYLFEDMNRSADGYSISCAADTSVVPGCELLVESKFMTAVGRIEGISIAVSGGAPSMQLELSAIIGNMPVSVSTPTLTLATTTETVRDPVTGALVTTVTTTRTDPQTGLTSTITNTRTTNRIVVTTPTITP